MCSIQPTTIDFIKPKLIKQFNINFATIAPFLGREMMRQKMFNVLDKVVRQPRE